MEDFVRFFDDPNYIRLKNFLFNYRNRVRLIKFYSNDLILGNDLADIGSGISPVTTDIQKTVFIDISKNALKVLSGKGLKTVEASVTKIPLKNESFDAVFCSEVLEHVKDYKKGLKEISRVLKKKGKAVITVPCWMNLWNEDDDFVGHYRRFNPCELEKDLKKTGLKLIRKRKIGSAIERKITIFLVKHFKQKGNMNSLVIPTYIIANYFLSWLITFASFFTSEKNASVILFIAEKQ